MEAKKWSTLMVGLCPNDIPSLVRGVLVFDIILGEVITIRQHGQHFRER